MSVLNYKNDRTVNASVGSVGPSAEAGRPVDLNVLDDKSVDVEALVVSVGLCVLEQLQQELCRLLGPPALGGAPLLGLRAAAHAAVEPPERHALLLRGHVLQELERSPQGHLLDGLGRFPCVLIKKTQRQQQNTHTWPSVKLGCQIITMPPWGWKLF